MTSAQLDTRPGGADVTPMEAGSPSPCLGRLTLKEVMGGQRSRDVEELLRRSRAELLWVQRQLSLISRRSASHPRVRDKLRSDLPTQQLRVLPPQSMERWRLLEEKNRCLRLEVATLRHERQQCRSLKNELHQALQEKSRLNQELSSQIQRAAQYERVKSDYDQLKETCTSVIQERDSALRERSQLQGRLEQLEQVLQHMHEAAERQQQLERDHELALEVLHARQQEIRHLQKVQVEAEKEHEGTVHQLEKHVTLHVGKFTTGLLADVRPMMSCHTGYLLHPQTVTARQHCTVTARVKELEQRCKTQAQQFSLLYQQLETFCLQSGTADTAGPVDKSLIQILSGLASGDEEGHTNSGDRWLKPKLLPVTPTSEERTQAAPPAPGGSSSPQRDSQPEMDSDLSRTTRSETRFAGTVRLCSARYSYNPYDGPNDHPEAELPLVAGKYLYIYGTMDDDGFYRGELPDGQRGLVPSNYVDFVQEKDVALTPGSDDSQEAELDREEGRCSLQAGKGSLNADELEEELVPYPRRITLIKQLARSVIVSWEPPAGQGGGIDKTGISAYDVLVDQEVRFRMPPTGRRKLLIEKLELSAQAYRISIRCVTQHGVSDELCCSLLVGRGMVLAPAHLQLHNVTQHSADLSWWPCDSNYKHAVLLDGVERVLVGPGRYRCRLRGLSPMTAYRVTVVAHPHRVPWRLPLEQREQRATSLDFCTLPAGPPLPPQEVRVLCGQTPGVLHVSWKPPILTSSGMSNGACVTGYAVCTRGQRIAEVMYPAAEHATVELNRIGHLEVRELVVRTLSAQGESQDSEVATIPQGLLVPPAPPPLPHILLPVCPRLVDLPLPSISTDPHIPNPIPQNEPIFQPHQPILQPPPLHSTLQAPSGDSWDRAIDQPNQCTEPGQSWASGCHPPSTLVPPTLEAPSFQARRSPSPQRILPQPQGAPIPNMAIKAMAREATQRAASSVSQMIYGTQSSDEEEDNYEHKNLRQKGISVHDFLTDSELGRQRGHSADYPSESSRGSDLSAITEEDEEELHSVMDKGGVRPHKGSPRSVLKILGSCRHVGRSTPVNSCSNRMSASSGGSYQRRAITVPSIEITPESNSEESLSLAKEQIRSDASLTQRKLWPPFYNGSSEHINDGALGQQHDGVARPKELSRIFVALFDYDPLSMSPNHDRAVEELSFQEGQILNVFGDKDRDGFYCGEINGRTGLVPCNMVAEIEAGDQNTTDQLVRQGFLPLSTPVAKIDRKRQGGRHLPTPKRKVVALYDYDPRENSPNTDMEAELTFSTGDIITILGEIDEDGFYYGEMNGQRGLVPSNFLEEVPDNVEIHLTGTQTVLQESKEPPQTTASPSPGPYLPAIGANVAPQNPTSKRKKGLLSKGKRLWKRLATARRAT
ncbi:RIMS-binding protein 2 [Brienomyrus brachyistius]|uniref:RIMS-binding protein 2 n=1 Tax=Brienomyrus brachyistius TaxID=42636 RepID=UPI0020B3271E|nr:RIMS-binding protein 2 [Brienomyrus brachyistius]